MCCCVNPIFANQEENKITTQETNQTKSVEMNLEQILAELVRQQQYLTQQRQQLALKLSDIQKQKTNVDTTIKTIAGIMGGKQQIEDFSK